MNKLELAGCLLLLGGAVGMMFGCNYLVWALSMIAFIGGVTLIEKGRIARKLK
jgi:hypothetical protein